MQIDIFCTSTSAKEPISTPSRTNKNV